MTPGGGVSQPRAQAATIGVVLITGMVIMSAAAVVMLGNQALTGTQQRAELQSAEQAMTQLDASAARVALGESPNQTVSLPSTRGGSVQVDDSAGWISIEIDCFAGSTDTIVNQQDLGAVVYEQGRTTIAYQGGGVWRVDGEGEARMVSPPEFHYGGKTLTLPIITIGNSDALDGRVQVTPVTLGQTRWPDPTASSCGATRSNPTVAGKVLVTVKSDYYRAWGKYFETQTEGDVSYNDPQNKATIELTSSVRRPSLTVAVTGTAGGDGLIMSGTGATTDSYDSTVDEYSVSQTTNGEVRLAADVEMRGNSQIAGTVRTGGDLTVDGTGTITGDVYYTGSCSDPSSPPDECSGASTISGIDSVEPITPLVDQRVSDISSDNNNGGADISGDQLDFGANSPTDEVTLTSGTYYLEKINMTSGETLTLDTSGGKINLAVKDYINVNSSSEIEVVGDGRVNVWVAGQTEIPVDPSSPTGTSPPSDVALAVGPDGVVDVGTVQDASQFFVYGREDFDAVVTNTTGSGGSTPVFEGVIYAPTSSGGSGEVFVMQGDVYGAVVSGTIEVGQYGEIHYDESLASVDTIPHNASTVKVKYLHVTVNEIEIKD